MFSSRRFVAAGICCEQMILRAGGELLGFVKRQRSHMHLAGKRLALSMATPIEMFLTDQKSKLSDHQPYSDNRHC
jgi:hypothetical protein